MLALKGRIMKHSRIGALSALALLVVSTAASAEITAEQVWENWRAQAEGYGQTLTVASEARSGDTLTIAGLTLASEFDGGSSTATIDAVTFRDRGDGTVEVTMSPQYPVTLTMTEPDGTAAVMNLQVNHPDLTIIASGSAAETRYDLTAPTIKVALAIPPSTNAPEVKGDLALAGLTGNYIVATDTRSRVSSTLQADSASLTMAMNDPTPDTGGSMNLAGNLKTLSSVTHSVLLPAADMADMAAALAAGFSSDGTFTYGAADFSFDLVSSSNTAKGSGAFGAGTVTGALNKDRLAYGGGSKEATVSLSSSGMPFPELVVSFAESAFDLTMPVSKTDAPQDFTGLLRLVDLSISEAVWAMVDPNGALPRDPATLVIDTSGKAKWLMDLFGTEAAQLETVPGELHALDVNELTLRALGASVEGKGAFTFDNSDTTTFDGMPLPTGKLDLTMKGANALLDKLSQTGLLPQDQVMGARMMMGLFARPGEGADTLTSTLEFKDKGFFANGQQLQ